MPRVPTYDQLQVAPNTLAQPTFSAAPIRPTQFDDVGQRQAAGLVAESQKTVAVANDLSFKIQEEANQLRVDDALNKVEQERLRLTFDQEAGFQNIRGEAALKRESGKPLNQEYSENLERTVGELSASLGNDAQRRAFQMRANNVVTSFRGNVLQHQTKEHNAWGNGVDEGTIDLRRKEIVRGYGDKAAVDAAINGKKDAEGNIVEAGISQALERIAKRNGKPASWVEQEKEKVVADAHRDVALRIMDEDPIKAFNYIKENADSLGQHLPNMQKAVRPAYDRAIGTQQGDKIYHSGGPSSADANSVIEWVIGIEGGYVANDAGKGETKFGINKTANPDIDIKNLTIDQASAIYKDRYWNGIGADKLPKEIRAIAFDTAVNQGVSTANRLLAASGGDPQKMIELRRQEYTRLIESNPQKFKKYEASWNSRLDKLQGIANSGGDRSVGGMLKEAELIEDREQRNVAISQIKSRVQIDDLARREAYTENITKAQDIAFAKPGGWREIPATVWSEIKPEDREKLRAGLPKNSDPDTLIMLYENPQLWKVGSIEQYRPLLSESDYRRFHTDANGPLGNETMRAAKIDNDQFKDILENAGMDKILNAKKGSPEQVTLIDLRAKFQQVIDAEQRAKGNRPLTIDEKNALLIRLVKPVKVEMERKGSLFGMFDGKASPAEMRAFQVRTPTNIVIPEESRKAIEADFNKRGILATPDRIRNAYLAREE